MSAADIVVIVLLALCVFFGLWYMSNHKGSCSGDCVSCGQNCKK